MLGRKSTVNLRIIYVCVYIYIYIYIYIYTLYIYTLCGENTEFLLGARYEAKKKILCGDNVRPSVGAEYQILHPFFRFA